MIRAPQESSSAIASGTYGAQLLHRSAQDTCEHGAATSCTSSTKPQCLAQPVLSVMPQINVKATASPMAWQLSELNQSGVSLQTTDAQHRGEQADTAEVKTLYGDERDGMATAVATGRPGMSAVNQPMKPIMRDTLRKHDELHPPKDFQLHPLRLKLIVQRDYEPHRVKVKLAAPLKLPLRT